MAVTETERKYYYIYIPILGKRVPVLKSGDKAFPRVHIALSHIIYWLQRETWSLSSILKKNYRPTSNQIS